MQTVQKGGGAFGAITPETYSSIAPTGCSAGKKKVDAATILRSATSSNHCYFTITFNSLFAAKTSAGTNILGSTAHGERLEF